MNTWAIEAGRSLGLLGLQSEVQDTQGHVERCHPKRKKKKDILTAEMESVVRWSRDGSSPFAAPVFLVSTIWPLHYEISFMLQNTKLLCTTI